jgi:hypothetical protein
VDFTALSARLAPQPWLSEKRTGYYVPGWQIFSKFLYMDYSNPEAKVKFLIYRRLTNPGCSCLSTWINAWSVSTSCVTWL